MLKFKSKINFANNQSKALKVGLPKKIAEILEAEAGDTMIWNVDVEDNNIKIIVTKEE